MQTTFFFLLVSYFWKWKRSTLYNFGACLFHQIILLVDSIRMEASYLSAVSVMKTQLLILL